MAERLAYPMTEIQASLDYYHADGAHVDNNNIYGTSLMTIEDEGRWQLGSRRELRGEHGDRQRRSARHRCQTQ